MQRMSVDLPDPDGPMMQMTSPLRTSKLMPLSTGNAPKFLRTSISCTKGAPASAAGGIMGGTTLPGMSSPGISADMEAALQAGREDVDGIAIEKEAEQRESVERREQVRTAALRCVHLRGDGQHLRHADDRRLDRGHRDESVEVHPRRQHALEALRQNHEPHRLATRQRERLGRLPLGGRDGGDGTAQDLRHVGHDRQGKPHHRLGPVGQRNADARERDAIGDEEHRKEEQDEPRRIAEELHDRPGAGARQSALTDEQEADTEARQRAERHGEQRDQDVEREAGKQQRRPLDDHFHRRERRWRAKRPRRAGPEDNQHRDRHARAPAEARRPARRTRREQHG